MCGENRLTSSRSVGPREIAAWCGRESRAGLCREPRLARFRFSRRLCAQRSFSRPSVWIQVVFLHWYGGAQPPAWQGPSGGWWARPAIRGGTSTPATSDGWFQMPVIPNLVERALFKLNLAPAVMLDFLGAMAFRAVIAARRLGVFEALSTGPMTSAQLARRIQADEHGTNVLLDALEALGYVESRSGRFSATPMAAKWLPLLGDGFGFCDVLVERLQDADGSVRRGAPAIDAREWLDQRPDGWREFQAGMVALARLTADDIVAKVRLRAGARRLLDVGGGHGLYSIKFCHRYPELSATVFDLPEGLEVTPTTIAAEGMEDRVSMQAGDFWIDSLGTGYDVVLLFNIVHANLPARNVELLQKVARALNPGGLVVILDQLTDKVLGGTSRAFAALMGLNLFNLTGGQAYGSREIADWLGTAGFARPQRIGLIKSPGTSLILATKAATGPNAGSGRHRP